MPNNGRERIAEIEKKLDEVNAKYGNENELCIFCSSKEYNGQQGIVHFPNCPIVLLRIGYRQIDPKKLSVLSDEKIGEYIQFKRLMPVMYQDRDESPKTDRQLSAEAQLAQTIKEIGE